MSFSLYLAFVTATVILILIPGPNVALIVANSVAYGTRYGLLTVAGTTSAIALQLIITVAGVTTVLTTLATVFDYLRWLGVAYLVYLGVRAWRAPPIDLTEVPPQPRSARAIFGRGLAVGLTNPKTLLFYGAFFPQFIDPNGDVGRQLVILAVTFFVLGGTLDSVWALTAGHARQFIARQGRLRNRLTGSLLIGCALGLAVARKS